MSAWKMHARSLINFPANRRINPDYALCKFLYVVNTHLCTYTMCISHFVAVCMENSVQCFQTCSHLYIFSVQRLHPSKTFESIDFH